MGASVNGTPQDTAGRKSGPIFLGEPQQSLFRPDPPSWTAFVRWVARAYVKQIAARAYPDSDPEQAADNMYRILENRHKRHFAIDWLDHVFAEVPEAAEAFVFFVCDRLGYERPAKKPDPVKVQEELAGVRRTVDGVTVALREVTATLERIEGRR